MPKYNAHQALLWQLIAKNRKRRLALNTPLRKVYQRRQLLLRVACLTVLLSGNNNGAAVLRRSCRRFQRNVGCLPTYGPLTARNGLKRLSGYLDLHLCFYWVAFVTQLKKTPSLKSLSPPEARLAICLYRLARGDYYFTLVSSN